MTPTCPTVTITISEEAARAALLAVTSDPDRTKWGHHQWLRTETESAIRAALDAAPERTDNQHDDGLAERVRALAEEWSDSAAYGECPDGKCGACTQGQDGQQLLAALRAVVDGEVR